MKRISTRQAQRNAALAKIKKTKPPICLICGRFVGNEDLMHIFPKSIYPQYYTEPLNVWIAHRSCHNKFDDSKDFRSYQGHIVNIAKQFATKEELYQYFNL